MTKIMTSLSPLLFAIALLLGPSSYADQTKIPALADTLGDWIAQLETDGVKAPIKFARDEKSAKAMQEHWEAMKKAHEKHDYRKWLDAAKKVEEETKFVVGGHDYSHLHVEWTKDETGWKLSGISFCR